MRKKDSPPVKSVADPERLAEKLPEHVASPEDYALVSNGEEPPHNSSLTAIAAETLETGLFPEREIEEVPGQDDVLRAGDPDVAPLGNLLSGEEQPGASQPTPDQNDVDEIGRASGVGDEDQEALRSTEELLEGRDARRWEQEPLSGRRWLERER